MRGNYIFVCTNQRMQHCLLVSVCEGWDLVAYILSLLESLFL